MKIKTFVVAGMLAGTLLCPAAELELTGKTDREDALYPAGGTALFEFCVKDSLGNPQKNVPLKIHYEGDREAVSANLLYRRMKTAARRYPLS